MKYRSSSQAFKFNIPDILQMTKIIKEDGEVNINSLAEKLGWGIPKANENIQYMIFCDILEEKQVSKFGIKLIELTQAPSFIEQLLLYKLSRGSRNGGHYYFSRLINQVLYDYAFQINNFVTLNQVIEKALMVREEEEYSKDSNKVKEKNYIQAFRGGLADKTTGFGKMGMVVEKDGQYEITGYIPDRLVTAYIIYDNWPKGRMALKRDEIYTMNYYPAKIFFIGPRLFDEQIDYLIDERILNFEREAGLNQITRNPGLTADKIMDRIVEKCINR